MPSTHCSREAELSCEQLRYAKLTEDLISAIPALGKLFSSLFRTYQSSYVSTLLRSLSSRGIQTLLPGVGILLRAATVSKAHRGPHVGNPNIKQYYHLPGLEPSVKLSFRFVVL